MDFHGIFIKNHSICSKWSLKKREKNGPQYKINGFLKKECNQFFHLSYFELKFDVIFLNNCHFLYSLLKRYFRDHEGPVPVFSFSSLIFIHENVWPLSCLNIYRLRI